MRNYAYSHSTSFAHIKSVAEQLPNNLTTMQYLGALDILLFKAVRPILVCSSFVETFLPCVLAWQTFYTKRKVSNSEKNDLSGTITLLILSSDIDKKMKHLQQLRLDRAVLFTMIDRWHKSMVAVNAAENSLTPNPKNMEALRDDACIRGDTTSHVHYMQSVYWFSQACSFKSMILEKYARLVSMRAQRDYQELGHKVRLDDIVQTYMLMTSRAIDRCDQNRGVLTTYVNHWFKTAKAKIIQDYLSNFQEHLASDILPESQDDKDTPMERLMNDADMWQASIEDTLTRYDTIDRVRALSRAVDPTGYGRLLLGVQHVLSDAERMRLRSVSVKQKL
jgi:hypothetical protein